VTTAWMVRGGRDGERESAALSEGLVIAGWEEVGDLSRCSTKPDLRRELERTYPDASRARIGNWTGQLWRLIHDMAVGDLVVIPLKSQPVIAIGRLTGDYQFRDEAPPGFRHVRPAIWLCKDLPRSVVRQDLLDSMGSLLTVCRIERFGAADRIEQLAESGIDPGPPGEDSAEISSVEALAASAAAASPDRPFQLTIRDLLMCWGVVRRTPDNVSRIEADLIDLGLTTRPAFTEGWIDNVIHVLVVGEEPGDEIALPLGPSVEVDEKSNLSTFMLRIDRLEPASAGVEFVHPEDAVQVAQTKMVANNYSQLAVIDENGELRGAIGWESIGIAHIAGPAAAVRSAITMAHVVNHDEDLLSRIDEIYRSGYVFVRGTDRKISGIVTAADLTERFGELVRPLVLIEEAERRLRRRVAEVFTAEQIASLTKNRAKSVDAMTLGNYPFVLGQLVDWQRLDWSLDHELFLEHLKDVCAIRNNFMHFDSDRPTEEADLERLAGFVRLLRVVDVRE
jgi:restriction system protein